jgi:heme/copper-type cytochrome/quinol oxidase subunit 3
MRTPRALMKVIPGARPAWRRWRPAGVAWALWALAMLSIPVAAWLDHLLRQAGRPDLLELTPTAIPPVLGAVSAATVGAVLATRRPRHPVGWLLLALGLSLSASGPAEAYTNYAVASPGAPPAAGLVALYMPATVVTAFACVGFVLLLTPTGSLPSPRWRWWARATVAAPVALLLAATLAPKSSAEPSQAVDNPLDLHALSGVLLVADQAAFAVTIIAFVVAAASLVVRFRRARGTERQQLRWVALATVVVSLLFVVALAALALESFALAALASSLCVAVLPVAIGAAILRYRLYDLDRIISRTLSYGLLTVLLGGAYAGVVLGLGELLGRASSLLVAGATLAVAAAFQPARRRIQQLVDRRFNRHRYDAAKTIAGFSARLRQAIDLDALTAELLAVVDQTMQPAQVSLWLRSSPPHGSPNTARPGDGAPARQRT